MILVLPGGTDLFLWKGSFSKFSYMIFKAGVPNLICLSVTLLRKGKTGILA